MTPGRRIDRHREREFFRKVLDGEVGERILLIRAGPGMGKTRLVEEFKEMGCAAGRAVALVDFRSAFPETTAVLAMLLEAWEGCPFPKYSSLLEQFSGGPEIRLDHITQIGSPQIEVVVNNGDIDTRRNRARELTRALIGDAAAWRPGDRQLVVLIDTYDVQRCVVGEELQRWVEGVFLAQVADNRGLVTVVAGQDAPAPSARWDSLARRIDLASIDDWQEWKRYVEYLQIPNVTDEVIQAFCDTHRGEPPGSLALLFEKLYRVRSASV